MKLMFDELFAAKSMHELVTQWNRDFSLTPGQESESDVEGEPFLTLQAVDIVSAQHLAYTI